MIYFLVQYHCEFMIYLLLFMNNYKSFLRDYKRIKKLKNYKQRDEYYNYNPIKCVILIPSRYVSRICRFHPMSPTRWRICRECALEPDPRYVRPGH